MFSLLEGSGVIEVLKGFRGLRMLDAIWLIRCLIIRNFGSLIGDEFLGAARFFDLL